MSAQSQHKLTLGIGEYDHLRGPQDAAVTLVEYGDFECSSCREAYGVVEELLTRHSETLRYAFRPFPLTQAHPNALKAAEACEAAGAQGKYWEMYDQLFRHQDALDVAALTRYAAEIGLDVGRFKIELDDGVWHERVQEFFMEGAKSGVNGTPTFFINGVRWDGGWRNGELEQAVTP